MPAAARCCSSTAATTSRSAATSAGTASTSSSQSDPRGTLAFTGAATGSALRRFSARPSGDQHDRVRRTPTRAPRRRLRRLLHRRLAAQRSDDESRRPVGIRVAVRGVRARRRRLAPDRRAASSRASRHRGVRCSARRWSSAAATASIATSACISRSRLLLAQQPPFARTFSVQNESADAAHARQSISVVDPERDHVRRRSRASAPAAPARGRSSLQRDLPGVADGDRRVPRRPRARISCRRRCRTRIRPAP